MTDAEPAPSCEAQLQVKVRRSNQVIALTSFSISLCSLPAQVSNRAYSIHDNPALQSTTTADLSIRFYWMI